MTPLEIINTLSDLGVTLQVQGGALAVAPKGKIPAALVDELRQHKPAVLALLSPEVDVTPVTEQREVITSLARLREVVAQADRVPVEPFDVTDYGSGVVAGWQPLSTAQVEGHTLLACLCPRAMGGAVRGDCCPACEMAMTCPDCGKCRGCNLMLRIDSLGPPYLRKKSKARSRLGPSLHSGEEDE
jgi:hypothetical protein